MKVSIEITGYLGKQFYIGNHFFEIAAAYAYALRHGRALYLPTRGAGTEPFVYSGYFEKCLPFVRDLEGDVARYSEPAFSYNEIPATNIPGVCLQGYFQSEKYFAEYAAELRILFHPPPSISSKAVERWGSYLGSPETHVLVHARRGDYLKAAAFHKGPCVPRVHLWTLVRACVRALGPGKHILFPHAKTLILFASSSPWLRHLQWQRHYRCRRDAWRHHPLHGSYFARYIQFYRRRRSRGVPGATTVS